MLSELKNRGIADALIVCCDGLRGLPDAIRVTWPEATVQTCVVHLLRNSLRYASKKYWAQITRQLRAIYTAPTVAAAEQQFAEFSEAWKPLYPAMIQSWEKSWNEFVPFLEYPLELRKIVYTTDRVAERPLPQSRPSSRALPQRAGRDEGPLPRRNDAPPQQDRPHRQDQRLEGDPQRPHRPLRRATLRCLDQE